VWAAVSNKLSTAIEELVTVRIREIVQVKRVNDVFELYGHRIPSVRRASDGFGVLVILEPSQLDKDFEVALGCGVYCWFPSAEELKMINDALDFSDSLTCDWLRNGKGWRSGPRPYNKFTKPLGSP